MSGINYGWRDPNSRFRTMMSYRCQAGQCDNNPGARCDKILRFSSASLDYNGVPTGDDRNDCASYINSVREQVAAFETRSGDAQCPSFASTSAPAAPFAPVASKPPPTEQPVSPPKTEQPVSPPKTEPTKKPTKQPTEQPITQLTFPPVAPPETEQPVIQLTFPPVAPPETE